MAERPTNAAPVDRLLDLLVYAPIGLTLDVATVGPDLARRGRQHAAAARQIGEFAVRAGMRRLDVAIANFVASGDRAGQASGSAAEAANTDVTVDSVGEETEGAAVEGRSPEGSALEEPGVGDTAEPVPSVETLAISDYDLLAASQVVKRLDALTPEELEAVRRYEAATRDRRTILHKIARLQG